MKMVEWQLLVAMGLFEQLILTMGDQVIATGKTIFALRYRLNC